MNRQQSTFVRLNTTSNVRKSKRVPFSNTAVLLTVPLQETGGDVQNEGDLASQALRATTVDIADTVDMTDIDHAQPHTVLTESVKGIGANDPFIHSVVPHQGLRVAPAKSLTKGNAFVDRLGADVALIGALAVVIALFVIVIGLGFTLIAGL